jgi:4a-hydroxytetrahydrobiopterin dehydratase
MAQRITQSSFATRFDLPDWRIFSHALIADFRFANFSAAAEFVAEVGRAADAQDHHPNVWLRYPAVVQVLLTSHDAQGLSPRDARLAQTVSELAGAAGATSQASNIQRLDIAIDALDIGRLLPFWKAALGYVEGASHRDDGVIDELVDPLGIDPPIWFQQMDIMRPQRSRVHLDVRVTPERADERIAAALAAGGRLLNDEFARAFWVLADPEGNEVCVCTWQDRD